MVQSEPKSKSLGATAGTGTPSLTVDQIASDRLTQVCVRVIRSSISSASGIGSIDQVFSFLAILFQLAEQYWAPFTEKPAPFDRAVIDTIYIRDLLGSK